MRETRRDNPLSAKTSRVKRDDILSNISRSLNGFHQITSVEINPDLPAAIIEYSNDEERIYQSVGIVII